MGKVYLWKQRTLFKGRFFFLLFVLQQEKGFVFIFGLGEHQAPFLLFCGE